MKKILILLTTCSIFLCLGCSKPDQPWFQSNVGRYQVLHYTTTTIPHTEFYLRLDTVTGKTELFHRDGGVVRYLASFYGPEVEGKKLRGE
jgi:hypothetical protein